MPPQKQTEQFTPKPALDADVFAAQVNALHRGVHHGADVVEAVDLARGRYMRLDPIETAMLPPESRPPVHAAMGRLAFLTEQAGQEKGSKSLSWPVGHLKIESRLDQADMGFKTPGVALKDVGDNIDRALDVIDLEGHRMKGVNEHDLAFAKLSAKAMKLHLQAQEIAQGSFPEHRKRGAQAILQASLAKLTGEAVEDLNSLHGLYTRISQSGRTADHVSGRMAEHMYFAYKLLDWYRSGDMLSSGYPRFAFTREDRSFANSKLKRSFDVVAQRTGPDEKPDLVQVKASRQARYSGEITVWAPNKSPITHADQIVNWFNTVTNNEADDATIDEAWRRLDSYFSKGHRSSE